MLKMTSIRFVLSISVEGNPSQLRPKILDNDFPNNSFADENVHRANHFHRQELGKKFNSEYAYNESFKANFGLFTIICEEY